jgi:hypothetical protein
MSFASRTGKGGSRLGLTAESGQEGWQDGGPSPRVAASCSDTCAQREARWTLLVEPTPVS